MKTTQINVCEYCDKRFSSARNLQVHIRTAKYCLKLRGEKLNTNYICEYCKAQFTQKSALKTHLNSCQDAKNIAHAKDVETLNERLIALESVQTKLIQEKNKIISNERKEFELSKQKLLKELEEKNAKISEQNAKISEQSLKIIKLENDIAKGKGILIGINSAKPPIPQVIHNNHSNNNKTVTNNTTVNQKLSLIPINNIEPFTIEFVNRNINKYDYNTFLKGELGIVNFIKDLTILELDDGTIEKNYASTNRSRNNFHRLIEDKEWKQDGGARFIQEILTSLAGPASEHMKQLTKELAEAPIQSIKKQVLLKMQNDLSPLECGLRDKNSKERKCVFTKVRNEVKDTNGC